MHALTRQGLRAYLDPQNVHSSRQAAAQGLVRGGIQILRNPSGLIGAAIIVLLVLAAILAPLLATHNPYAQNLQQVLLPPGADHWFGTDNLGRDIYSRIVYGARATLTIVCIVSVIVGPIGIIIGATAGYFGGLVDTVLMRITDVFLSLPSLVLALAFAAALGPGLDNAIIAISFATWPPIARLARAEAMTIRKSDYVAAARMMQASDLRIILRQIIPMCTLSVVVRLTLNMAGVILVAAGLGFLGVGAQPPLPEWGAMIAVGRQYMLDSWWTVTFPGLAIVAVSLAFNLFGDALRDTLDPRSAR
ncbi:ABC transporter permease [Devosia ginsengisoli]|uniref:ABC transporter permease n=1 Tax=Devosia ginsengisoli TaxID=400770 RepID=UPI0026EAA3AB|nr:ABC transporter permease [Devosia ginsengisoli]MCR6670763.1 ABC transporter permease [Devosia ginsengisoli]